MLDFLNKVGISDETINKIDSNNNKSLIFDLSCNYQNCIKIILYLHQIGINNIDDLLIYRIDLFLLNYDEFIEKMNKINISIFKDQVNDDYTAIDTIFE